MIDGQLHFPDSRIGASLKPGTAGRRPCRTRNFPDSRIGASLKRRTAVCCRACSATLPRFANRGLIEAASPDQDCPDCPPLPRFANRGLIEADLNREVSPEDDTLPRFANRGLIEAVIVDAPVSFSRWDFPDSRIGASLKPGGRHGGRGAQVDFPDSRIGASLKRDDLDRTGTGARTSPIRESGPH